MSQEAIPRHGAWSDVDETTPTRGKSRTHISKWLLFVGVVVVLSGLLFGYDQGVIGGALAGIQRTFRVSTVVTEIITSWVTLGAMAGALVAGGVADRWGRRPAILVGAVLFTGGAIVEAVAPSATILVGGRLLLGVGVGVASVAAPLYGAEVAPTRLRGRFVSMYQLAITFGIFFAYLIDQLIAGGGRGWRLVLGLSAVPSVLLVAAMLPMPDSPVWYLKAGKPKEAAAAFSKVRPDEDAAADLDAVKASLGAKAASWGEVFSKHWQRPLVVGVGLAVLQQFTGVNAIIYYADKVFAAAGFHSVSGQATATTWSIGAVNVLFTFVAVLYVDRFGRRPLLLAGLVGMFASLATVGACFLSLSHITMGSTSPSNHPSDTGVITLVALVVFIASFAFSLGPVVWTVINEIFPSHVRGRAVAVATAANWLACWLVSQVFLSMVHAIGESATFWVFGAVCVIAFVFVWKLVPETKGKSLAEIQAMWATRDSVTGR